MKIKKLVFIWAGIFFLLAPSGFGQITEQTLKFGEVLNDISRYYVDTVNEEKLVSKALR